MKSFGILRGINDDEIALMLEWRNSPNVTSNMFTRNEISMTTHLSWWNKVKASKNHKYFMYELDGIPAGIVGMVNIDHTNQNSSWIMYASPDAPKGTGSKMEFLFLDYVFKEYGLHKLYGEVLAFNTSVINLHKKFGFAIEGILFEHHAINDGFTDIHLVGITKNRWNENRDRMKKLILSFEGQKS